MTQIYNKVFIQSHYIKFVEFSNLSKGYITNNREVLIDEASFLYNFDIDDKLKNNYVLLCVDANKAFKQFRKLYTYVKAAGGVTFNQRGEVLFIFRKGKWDLPKGKLEKGESMKEAAVREVAEECGIDLPVLNEKVTTTHHIYSQNGIEYIKKTNWYKMQSSYEGQLTPQFQEEITDVKWVDAQDISTMLDNTYPAIKDVIKLGIVNSISQNQIF